MNTELVAVSNISCLTGSVYRILFSMNKYTPFSSGQYLKLWLDEVSYRPYSIATPNYISDEIEIFIGCKSGGDSIANCLIKKINERQMANITFPYGSAYYRNNNSKKILIVVEGTGYGYGKGIVLASLKNMDHETVHLVWYMNDVNSIWEIENLNYLKSKHLNFNFFIVSDKELIYNFLFQDYNDLYLAGSLKTVQEIKYFLYEKNDKINLYCDL